MCYCTSMNMRSFAYTPLSLACCVGTFINTTCVRRCYKIWCDLLLLLKSLRCPCVAIKMVVLTQLLLLFTVLMICHIFTVNGQSKFNILYGFIGIIKKFFKTSQVSLSEVSLIPVMDWFSLMTLGLMTVTLTTVSTVCLMILCAALRGVHSVATLTFLMVLKCL